MEILRHLRTRGHVSMRRTLVLALVAISLGACAKSQPPRALTPVSAAPQWPIKTREHVDLWLHGFAMLQDDTATVPLFDRGYRDRLTVAKNSREITTLLDTNRDVLSRAIAARPALIGAQFIPLYFGGWAEMLRAFEYFQVAKGEPRSSNNPEVQGIIAFLAAQFPTPEDREFARLFVLSLQDEQQRFHHAWWLQEQRARTPGLAAADSLWQSRWRPALQRYLNHTQQGNGDLLVTLALGGEGRALPAGKNQSQYAVAWPTTADSADVLLFSFAHEAAGAVAAVAVNDNLTPVQQREGLGDKYAAIGLVRGGALLVERIDPALAERYARWYLMLAGRPVPASGAMAALETAFPMPPEMIASMRRQIEISFSGI